mgnify:CR=1 FL=1
MGDISNWKNRNRTYAGKGTASIKLTSDEEKNIKKKINLGLSKFDEETGRDMPIKKVKK